MATEPYLGIPAPDVLEPEAERASAATMKSGEPSSESLMMLPELGSPGEEPGTRELVISGTRYKFTLVYRLASDQIQIAALWHGRQSRKK